MLYLQFWDHFWKEWTSLGAGAAADSQPALQKKPAAATGDGLTAQEKYEYLTEYGSHILCLMQSDKGCTYLSDNFKTITGINPEHYLGNGFFHIVHEDYHARLGELLTMRIPGKKPQQLRCKLRHDDDKWYWYSILIHSKQGPQKDPGKGEYVCIIENIHDSIQIQSSLQKSKLEAELALRSRSEFLSNMSHELRTPLNAVIGFAQIMESEIFGKIEHPQYLEYIKHIHESGYDLLSKIEDLLEIANIDAGRVALSLEEVKVHDIFKHILETQKHHAMSAQVTLDVSAIPADMLLHVDRLKMQHILGHLVTNAIRFSPQGTTVTLKATIACGGLQILVKDKGTGMTGAKLNAITSALQEDNCWTAAGNNHSIGLGLALTREFVALHGGLVAVKSKPAEGTTVIISLPKECIREQVLEDAGYLKLAAN